MKDKISLITLFVTCLIFLTSFSVFAVPRHFNYQGKLTDNQGNALEGNYQMRFNIFNSEGGEESLWNEQQSVTLTEGIYSIQLGIDTPFPLDLFDNDALYLEVTMYNPDLSSWETLSPRVQLSSGPFAMKAGDAETLEGMIASDFAGSAELAMHADNKDAHHSKTTSFSELTDTATDAQIPNNITIDKATSAGNSDTVDGKHASDFIGKGEDNSVTNNMIVNGTVGSDDLANDSITSAKIQNGTIKQEDLSFKLDAAEGSLNDAVFVDASGNVGIGKTELTAKLDVAGSARANSFISGATTTYADGSITMSGPTTTLGIMGGNVGIGTANPGSRLDIKAADKTSTGGLRITSNINDNSVIILQDSKPGDQGLISIRAGGSDRIGLRANGYSYFNGGNVGIGTTNPGSRLDIKAADKTSTGGLRITSNINDNSVIILQDSKPGDQGLISIRAGGSDRIGLRANGYSYFNGGNVGIGVKEPQYKLTVDGTIRGGSLDSTEDGVVGVSDSSNGVFGISNYGHGGYFVSGTAPGLKVIGGGDASLHDDSGYVLIGHESGKNIVIDENEIIARNNGNGSKLYLNNKSGNVVIGVLEITGGADIAEPFRFSNAQAIKPGMIVTIDPERTGNLRIADKAYDPTVAGVVSGANGINPGLTMAQKETIADGSFPVALTGRVYALADASNAPIEPGNLLTTSDIPGHAMKVTDYTKAQGAILGKAMSSLESGQGLVLILVTLQ